jgi:hypothetical protein
VNLYPFAGDRREARLHLRRRDREHRHRRSGDGARRGEEPRPRRDRDGPGRLRASSRRARGRRRAQARGPLTLAKPRRSRTRRVRRHDRPLPHEPRRRRQRQPFPDRLNHELRESAGPALRREPAPARRVLSRPRDRPPAASRAYAQLQGKELSYNNIADADAAWECVRTFDVPACVIVKHANPCGVAQAASVLDAYQQRVHDGSDLGLRRHHRVQPRRSTARRPSRDHEAVRRSGDRPGLHAEALATFAPRRTCAC